MKLSIPVICECGFLTMDAEKAMEHAKGHQKKETLIATNVKVGLETLRVAQSSMVSRLSRDLARANIVDAVINSLDNEDWEKLQAYIKGE